LERQRQGNNPTTTHRNIRTSLFDFWQINGQGIARRVFQGDRQ